jgi:hypothetical protein
MVDQPHVEQDLAHSRIGKAEHKLKWIRWVGLVDLVMLIALVTASLSGNRELVRILGPLHGGNFLLLLTLTFVGASDQLWSWWFPTGVLVTGGPIGAIVGDIMVGRRLKRERALAGGQGGA